MGVGSFRVRVWETYFETEQDMLQRMTCWGRQMDIV